MTNAKLKKYSIKTLCRQIAKILTREEIKSQIQRFSKRRVVPTPLDCALCRYFRYALCKGCPYYKFESPVDYGCMCFSEVMYDGTIYVNHRDGTAEEFFGTKARRAALERYKLALKFKVGNNGKKRK